MLCIFISPITLKAWEYVHSESSEYVYYNNQDGVIKEYPDKAVIQGSWKKNQQKVPRVDIVKESTISDNKTQEQLTESIDIQQNIPALKPEPADLKVLIDANQYVPITISRATLFKADLKETSWRSGSRMMSVYAKEINLEKSSLCNASWNNINVKNANLRSIYFWGTMFNVWAEESDLSNAFICGKILNADFQQANLTNAKLAGDFINVNFTGAITDDLSFDPNTNLAKTTGLSLTNEQIIEAKKNNCILPRELEMRWLALSAYSATAIITTEARKYTEEFMQKISQK